MHVSMDLNQLSVRAIGNTENRQLSYGGIFILTVDIRPIRKVEGLSRA